ncbi:restriction endonuclease subunit S [Staphylococcus aureus]|uniref:Type I restriction-modification system, specificity subunit S n=2 Tax=Staphylococcus aureus TaxID=1280 RepID=A0A8G2HW47_STAAU|nr:restriction endonuclease subunit S [Staphylococcus aureus]KIT72712.1 restriction endonuclease subunit S [Staphylococcus aureus]MBZ5404144.1 restriction endonuclease subunit S [Staphylococcus aureus]MBZ5422514.1 restriction endonuclease subunit S [Staphylococcus aureus]MDI0205536.1 restriction endonuclease subunit S [Staphylococcus aureus]MDI0239884.1 restriction endonuclease subunit S [Staphylococcus aureus]
MSNTQKKNVPELRFPGFEGEWEEKKLESIIKVNSGKDYKHLDKGDIPVYGTGGYMTSVSEPLSEIDAVGIGRKGTINKPYLLEAPFWTVDTLFYCTPKKETDILFILSLFRKINWKVYDESTGVPSLSKQTINKINRFVPTNKEQQKIGKFFSKLDRQIELEEQKLELLQQQKKGYMQKIFSQELRFKDENGNDYPEWENVMLQKVLKDKTEGIKRGPFGGALKKDIFVESGYAVYEQRNAIYDISNFRYYINENKYKEMQSFSVQPNDIIMSCSGTIGRLALIPQNYTKGIINQALIRFRTNHKIRSEFFLIFMRSNQMQRKILEANPGSAITNLVPVKELKLIPFPLPVKFEQDKISQFILIINRRIEQSEKKIESLKNRKQGFLQKLFV